MHICINSLHKVYVYTSDIILITYENMQINPEVDVLSVNSAHQIGVRLKSEKEKYHKLVDELKSWFSENGCQELRGFEDNIPCIWKSPTSWYRSIIVSQKVWDVDLFQMILILVNCLSGSFYCEDSTG